MDSDGGRPGLRCGHHSFPLFPMLPEGHLAPGVCMCTSSVAIPASGVQSTASSVHPILGHMKTPGGGGRKLVTSENIVFREGRAGNQRLLAFGGTQWHHDGGDDTACRGLQIGKRGLLMGVPIYLPA